MEANGKLEKMWVDPIYSPPHQKELEKILDYRRQQWHSDPTQKNSQIPGVPDYFIPSTWVTELK